MNLLYWIFISVLVCVTNTCNKQDYNISLRSKVNLNNDWLYVENPTDSYEAIKAENQWHTINLPHSWNSTDATDNTPGYRRSASWYKKNLSIESVNPELDYVLYFEGVNITTKVYVNGNLAGGHIGGYIGFEVDMTPYIKSGSNEVLVRVDNTYNRDIIPSQKSDFIIFGGITRDVWLISKPSLGISQLKVTTPEVNHESAILQLEFSIRDYKAQKNLVAEVQLKDANGKIVTTSQKPIKFHVIKLLIDNIKNPHLWDVHDPYLYDIEVTLKSDNTILDHTSDRVGFRWFEFKDHGPFYLNGKRLLLRGTHRHEEHAGVGAAMTDAMHREDIRLIKEMGANFIRLAHYPQDPEVYRACDELGILVWDELPWCRGGIGDDTWKSNTKNMLQEIITQNYNHPSIIMWSLGNEIYWLPDFEGGDDTDQINVFLTELNTLAHDLDPYRKTAIRKYYEGAGIVDVFSPSIWSGWYSGSYKSYQKALDTYKPQYKHFIHTEYGGSSHLGRHTENPINGDGIIKAEGWEEAIVQTGSANIAKIGDWSENYIVDLFDWHLRITESDSTFIGNAQWAFKDFATPLRPENAIPYMNQKGLVDRDNNPKDAYYVFKSYWSEDPFVYIESHTWTDRQGPSDLKRNISVFSNCNQVRLIHDGRDLGYKTKDLKDFPASGLNWDILFKEGSNQLIAVGLDKNNNTVSDTLTIQYRHHSNSNPLQLNLSAEPQANGTYLISAIAQDKDGLRCLDYEEKVYFQCLKGGHILKHQGTPTGSDIVEMANGLAHATLIPSGEGGDIVVMILNQNFKGTYLTIEN